jgi:hypothetical protein
MLTTHRARQVGPEPLDIVAWAPDEDYPVFPVGSKPKRLLICPQNAPAPFLIPGHKYMFKVAEGWQSRQLWSEILAYELARSLELGVPPCFAAWDSQTNEMDSYATSGALGVGRFALYQVLERNRQRPRGEFAEQIAVQIIHLRAHEDSDPSPVAPDRAVSNHRNDLRRVSIDNDVLGKDEILSHGFCLEDDGLAGKAFGFVTIPPPP